MSVQCGSDAPCVTCQEVTGCVQLSNLDGNQIGREPDGLHVPDPARTVINAGDGIGVTGGPIAGYTVAVRPSTDLNNALQFGADRGLFVPPCSPSAVTGVADTATVAMAIVGGDTATATVKISATPGNILTAQPDGLHVPTAGGDPALLISADAGNQLRLGSDSRLWTPPPAAPPAAGDGLTLIGGVFAVGAGPGIAVGADTVAVALSADPGNLATISGGGVFVPSGVCAITAVADTSSIDMTLAGSTATGAVIISPDAGNTAAIRGNGLYAPAQATAPASTFISADAGNQLVLGVDAKLFVPAPPTPPTAGAGLRNTGGVFSVETGPGLRIVDTTVDQVAVKLSADAGNMLKFGTDNGVYAPDTPQSVAFIRWRGPSTQTQYTLAPTATIRVRLDGASDNQSGSIFSHVPASGEFRVLQAGWQRADLGFSIQQTAVALMVLQVSVALGASTAGALQEVHVLTVPTGQVWLPVSISIAFQVTASQVSGNQNYVTIGVKDVTPLASSQNINIEFPVFALHRLSP